MKRTTTGNSSEPQDPIAGNGDTMTREAVRRVVGLALTGTAILAGAAAQGHHSIAGAYDSSRERTVEGVITQFRFVSPHPFIELKEVRTGQPWQLELDNRREFEAIGITADSLKAGDRVIAAGSMSRREANQMYARRLSRPADGFGFEEVGSRPQLSGRRR
jgi:hypothetical protein